jgi:phytoene synthase
MKCGGLGSQPGDLLAAQTTDRVRQLFAFQAERIRYHRRALEALPTMDRYHPVQFADSPGAGDGAAGGNRRGRLSVAGAAHPLTPLRKLWLAWRVRRRHRRACDGLNFGSPRYLWS